jgi:hypothetical protein
MRLCHAMPYRYMYAVCMHGGGQVLVRPVLWPQHYITSNALTSKTTATQTIEKLLSTIIRFTRQKWLPDALRDRRRPAETLTRPHRRPHRSSCRRPGSRLAGPPRDARGAQAKRTQKACSITQRRRPRNRPHMWTDGSPTPHIGQNFIDLNCGRTCAAQDSADRKYVRPIRAWASMAVIRVLSSAVRERASAECPPSWSIAVIHKYKGPHLSQGDPGVALCIRVLYRLYNIQYTVYILCT